MQIVFENRVLRRTLESKGKKLTREKLQNEELGDCTPFHMLLG
jgi:hypothetical protein